MTKPLAAIVALAALAAATPAAAQDAAALKKSCDKGQAADCRALASMHAKGEGAPLDLEKAASYLKKACDLRLSAACLELARAARAGEGFKKKEPERAALLYGQACDAGGPRPAPSSAR